MKQAVRNRFNLRALREMAGAKAFARGEAYHHAGQVTVLAIDGDRVLAEVAGTDDYRTVLTGRGTEIGGECSCPAFEDWGFCKHMVAAALAANEAGPRGADNPLERIRSHLKARGVDALVEMIVELAERDPALFRRLDLAAAAVGGDAATLETRLRKAIDDATRTRGVVDYREVPAWAEGVDATLDALADLAAGPNARLALTLAEHALARIEDAVCGIDDSDGRGGALLDRCAEIHLAASRAARPDPVALARDLFARETARGYDTFLGAAARYAEVLGEPGLAEYRRLASEAWEQLPPRSGRRRFEPEAPLSTYALERILDWFAERDGDLDARIALRTRDLSSPWQYLQLAEFCRAHGRADEALRHAEEGLWVFEDERPDERLVFLAIDLLAQAGRSADAEALLWRAFEAAPSLDLYRRLRGDSARERAVALLESRLEGSSSADLLVRVLMKQGLFARAWETVRTHPVGPGLMERLARASEATHPREALVVYAERVEQLARAGGNPAYAEAAELVARMVALRDATEQAAYVAMLKDQHRRKRNFMKLLE